MRKTIMLGTTLILFQIPLLAYVLLQERTWGWSGKGRSATGSRSPAMAACTSRESTRSFGAGGDDAFLLKYGARRHTPVAAHLWNRAGRFEQRRGSRHRRCRGAGQFRRAGGGELPRRQHLPREVQPRTAFCCGTSRGEATRKVQAQ